MIALSLLWTALANSKLMCDAIFLALVSRRDEVAGIRAKFPSKIPVSVI